MSTSSETVPPRPAMRAGTRTKLNRQQIVGFWAAWFGWMLDGMDSVIYALVLGPALTELLPVSGMEATPANVGLFGSIMFALFLVGWGLSFIWGPIADRFGRTNPLPRPCLSTRCSPAPRPLRRTLAARPLPFPCGHRRRRRMGDGRHLCRRSLARRSAQDGGRVSADRLLFRLLCRGG